MRVNPVCDAGMGRTSGNGRVRRVAAGVWRGLPTAERTLAVIGVISLVLTGYATQRQLVLTRQAMMLAQRPWVGIYSIKWEPGGYVVVWKNSGQGPAINVVDTYMMTIMPSGDEPSPGAPIPGQDLWPKVGLFPPGATIRKVLRPRIAHNAAFNFASRS